MAWRPQREHRRRWHPLRQSRFAVDSYIGHFSEDDLRSLSSGQEASEKGTRGLTTTPEPPDDSYPAYWRPAEVRRREESLNPTEAELWLGSLSPAELQAALVRAQGETADGQRPQASPTAAGSPRTSPRPAGTLPGPLKNLLAAHSVLAASTALPARGGPETAIVDCALDGSLTPEKLAELLPAAASAAAVHEYAKQLAARTENILLAAFHREIGNGAADVILDACDARSTRLRRRSRRPAGCSMPSRAEHVLASGEPAVIEAWQELDEHLKVVAKVVVVARDFGCRPAQFPQLVEYPLADNHRVADNALFVADGDLAGDSAPFLRPDRPHRGSAMFKVVAAPAHGGHPPIQRFGAPRSRQGAQWHPCRLCGRPEARGSHTRPTRSARMQPRHDHTATTTPANQPAPRPAARNADRRRIRPWSTAARTARTRRVRG